MTNGQSLAGLSEIVDIEHTTCCSFVVCDRTGLPIGRPYITIAVDRCTRMVCGIYIGSDPPSVRMGLPSAGGEA